MIAKCHNEKNACTAEAISLFQGKMALPSMLLIAINKKKQKGASAIEFALVFPIFFLIFYAIITYGMIFVAQQSVTLAAAEGARAALRHANTETDRDTHALQAAIGPQSVAAWLGINNLSFNETTTQETGKIKCPYDATGGTDCYKVIVSYPYSEKPLIPLLLGPVMRVAIPTEISSSAIVQLN